MTSQAYDRALKPISLLTYKDYKKQDESKISNYAQIVRLLIVINLRFNYL